MNITKILGISSRKIARALGFAAKSQRVKKDLCSNTGLKSQIGAAQTGLIPSLDAISEPLQTISSGVDWLMGTMHDSFKDLESVREFVDYVASALGDTFIQASHGVSCGIQWHPYLWRGVLHGSQISCMICDRNITHVWVSITGKSCRQSQQKLARLMCYLAVNGFCCTRIDTATSDPKNRLKFHQISRAIDAGDCSGFRPSSKTGHKRISGVHGTDWTHYCGSRSGGKSYTRIYHSLENGYVRIERQYVKRDARLVFADIAHCYDDRDSSIPLAETDYFRKICSYSIGGINFIRRISKNLNRCPELRWWSAFKLACQNEPIKLPSISKVETLEVKKAWVERSVSTSLSMLKKWMGAGFSDWLYSIVASGANRLTPKQLAMLKHCGSLISEREVHFTGNLKEELARYDSLVSSVDYQIFNCGLAF